MGVGTSYSDSVSIEDLGGLLGMRGGGGSERGGFGGGTMRGGGKRAGRGRSESCFRSVTGSLSGGGSGFFGLRGNVMVPVMS
jgi:hypothetical protein